MSANLESSSVFIFGMHPSGTTLCQRLNGHNELGAEPGVTRFSTRFAAVGKNALSDQCPRFPQKDILRRYVDTDYDEYAEKRVACKQVRGMLHQRLESNARRFGEICDCARQTPLLGDEA